MSIYISGLNELNRKLNNIKTSDTKIESTLMDIGQDLLRKSKEIAPIDTGHLRSSGSCYKTDTGVIVGFNTPYALKQHEDLSLRHPNGGESKYLEKPFILNKSKYIDKIKKTIKEVFNV